MKNHKFISTLTVILTFILSGSALSVTATATLTDNCVGEIDSQNNITLNNLPDDAYTLYYENENGIITEYDKVCTLVAGNVTYDDFIKENIAPFNATQIGVYNSLGEKIGHIPLSSLSSPSLGEKLYSFGALSDIHIGYETSESHFQKALTYLTETENVSFVAVDGDLTSSCTDEQLLAYKSIIDSYAEKTTVYSVTGNHDTEQYRGSNIADSIASYTGQPMYYSFSKGKDVFIFLGNYNGYDAGRIFIREQLQWLYETLEANRNKRCFIFEHIRPDSTSGNPLDLQSVDLWDGTEAIIFESLLQHYPNVTFFHGHSHTAFELQSDSDIANYDSSIGCHSIHIPALFATRELDEYGSYKNDYEACEGYVIDVYESEIIVKGVDFAKGKYLPIATYCLDTTLISVEADTYKDKTVTVNCNTVIPKWSFNTRIDATGSTEANADYSVTDLIPITESNIYYAHQYYGCPYWGGIIYYNADGEKIERATLWDNSKYSAPVKLEPPENAVAFRIQQWTQNDEQNHTKDVFITYIAKQLIGDAHLDGVISILDATNIQRHLTKYITLTGDALTVGDVNLDNRVDIKDATAIQCYLAELPEQAYACGTFVNTSA